MAEAKAWQEKRVVIIGAARQGLALARYLARKGAQVTLTDLRSAQDLEQARRSLADIPGAAHPVEWVAGSHPLSLLDGTDLVCPSGGVPLTQPLVQAALERGIPLSNDSQIFLEAAPCPVIGITGSAGKTTTTTLVGRMASSLVSRRTWVGGNIGSPMISVVDEMAEEDLAVMELSSFQLEIMTRSPQIAAVLNVTPNHLDRHGTMEAYQAAKRRILDFQSSEDTAVLGRDNPQADALAGAVRGSVLTFGLSPLREGQDGTYYRDEGLYLKRGPSEERLVERSSILLRGEHNLLNVLAACAIAAAAGLPAENMQAGVEGFRGVAHRLELVRNSGRVAWYNDSIATAPERTMAAVRSFDRSSDERLILLVGGRDKNLPWEDLAALAARRVDHLVAFGEAAGKIIDVMRAAVSAVKSQMTITHCSGLAEAVRSAAQIAEPGDVILLSPGGTSFDEFRDFEERGECFVRLVNELP
jgi:UDP-N-acetylmuramoylalanine--D-glutamate ligase